jgi:ArsR family transcriptional regulator
VPRQIYSASELNHLLESGAQLIDVLGREEFALDHIPGAVNIPLKELTAQSVAGFDAARPLVVYCNDFG